MPTDIRSRVDSLVADLTVLVRQAAGEPRLSARPGSCRRCCSISGSSVYAHGGVHLRPLGSPVVCPNEALRVWLYS